MESEIGDSTVSNCIASSVRWCLSDGARWELVISGLTEALLLVLSNKNCKIYYKFD